MTIVAVWAILIGTGTAFASWQPHIVAALLSLAVCTALLFAWAWWTPAGRRTPFPVYLLAGLLYILLAVSLLPAMPFVMAIAVEAGFKIGFQHHFAVGIAIGQAIVPILLNLFGPILLTGMLRGGVRGDLTR